jgi:hypothetical protein
MAPLSRALLLVAIASVFTRLVLQRITAALSLTSRYELSSPLTSSSRLIEGVYLMSDQQDPYATDLAHFPPWFLLLSRFVLRVTLPSVPQIGLLMLYACADAAVVVSMGFIHHALRATPLPSLTAVKICFNPLAILSCLALSSSSLYHAILFGSVALAAAAQVPMMLSLFFLAAASSLDFRAVTILPVLLATRSHVTSSCVSSSRRAQVCRGFIHASLFVLCYFVLLVTDVLILTHPVSAADVSFFARMQGGAWAIWHAVPMFDLQVRELVPSIGTAWYMMME